MAKIYFKAQDEIVDLCNKIINDWHQPLAKAKVRIGIIFAMSGKEGVPAVMHGGYPAAATIKIVPLKDRITKEIDAEMLIDADLWKEDSDAAHIALIDHELSHLALKKPKKKKKKGKPNYKEKDDGTDATENDEPEGDEAEFVTDDYNRPVLITKKGDFNVGDGFMDVISRHGRKSHEYMSVERARIMIEMVEKENQSAVVKPA